MQCKNLNIITGTNSSGKSTLLQAVLLFFQTYMGAGATLTLPTGLNGNLISLGDFRENKSVNVSDSKITIGLRFNNYPGFDNCPDKFAEVYFEEDENLQCSAGNNAENDIINMIDGNSDNSAVSDTIKYLSCQRVGAQDVFNKNYSSGGIGQNGEYAIYYFERNKSNIVENSLIRDTSSETLSAQVNYWLKYIVNATITTEDTQRTDIVKASYKVGNSRAARPKNVGSGISYLVSLLILCLSSEKNDIMIIENPEIHLHPKAQSKVCEFLYFIAKSGRQIFAETHSDHIFNGIRAGIATGEFNPEHITVNFLDLDERNCTKNTVIEFGKRGRILNCTPGLFDQFDIDLNKMLSLQ
jgi:predicted ATPase